MIGKPFDVHVHFQADWHIDPRTIRGLNQSDMQEAFEGLLAKHGQALTNEFRDIVKLKGKTRW